MLHFILFYSSLYLSNTITRAKPGSPYSKKIKLLIYCTKHNIYFVGFNHSNIRQRSKHESIYILQTIQLRVKKTTMHVIHSLKRSLPQYAIIDGNHRHTTLLCNLYDMCACTIFFTYMLGVINKNIVDTKYMLTSFAFPYVMDAFPCGNLFMSLVI